MLNGIDPILIFNFSKLNEKTKNFIQSASKGRIPITADIVEKIDLPSIPIYLSESLTGLYIETEDKSIEIESNIETLPLEADPKINQRGLNNTVKINLVASRDSIGLTLLTSMVDFIFPLVTSREYSITYLHGAITVFGGMIHSFSINQNSNNTLYQISLELVRVGIIPKTLLPKLDANPGTLLDPSKGVVKP